MGQFSFLTLKLLACSHLRLDVGPDGDERASRDEEEEVEDEEEVLQQGVAAVVHGEVRWLVSKSPVN